MNLLDLVDILKSLNISEIYNIKIEYVNKNEVDKCLEIKDLYED